ncbi:hypothetical protein BS47DRAFT_1327214 [Hydnum rufescens UP504]|uniref:Dihydroxyacetone kinase n=1 Tax=Hydnum rufescens UP504 TaxID=1448309 RepID=A0A9P6B2X0_9AGAM|nr:hypothetical protein BS47DRAFT_1327214 [Hydnum rufescens UP504]
MSNLHKHLLNAPSQLGLDSLNGLVHLNPALSLDEKHRVVYTRDPALGTVSLISGGGAGHEPAHASFVGAGVLSAAVIGSIFASPTVSQIRQAINLVSRGSSKGILLIVKNYTGDVLHFGLAAEQHRATAHDSESADVRTVIVADDVAVGRTQAGLIGRRGLAGTVLVYKIAGALAHRGGSLDQVEALAKFVAKNIATFGVGLEHCHIPGTEPHASRLAVDELELGMGIHNEPGFARIRPYPTLQKLVARLLNHLTSSIETDPERGFLSPSLQRDGKDQFVLLVNNLGSVSQLEMGGIVKEAVQWLRSHGFIIRRVLSGTYMTSLNMLGFSLTLLLLPRKTLRNIPWSDDDILELLDAPAEVPGWPWHAPSDPSVSSEPTTPPTQEPVPTTHDNLPLLAPSNSGEFVSAISRAATALIAAEPEITHQDTLAGDGDAGLTLKAGGEGILRAIEAKRIAGTNVIADILAIADVVDVNMGGTSGALYSIFFSGLASHLRSFAQDTNPASPEMTFQAWSKASSDALSVLFKYTRARPPSRTLVDPLSAFIEALQTPTPGSTTNSILSHALSEAHEAAQATRHLEAKVGRGSYVDQKALKEQNVPDPGAWGVWVILNALFG